MESSAFDYLDAPLERITGFDVPTPYAINIEKMAFPSVDNIVNTVRKVCHGLKV
jgi:pyruvate dehydrogenase E1 component beta subunit